MTSHASLEHALTELAAVLIPLGQQFGGPSPTAAALSLGTPIKYFFGLCIVNVLSFLVLRLLFKTLLGVIRSVMGGISAMVRPITLLRYLHLTRRRRRATAARARTRQQTRRTRVVESSSTFESWEDFTKRYNIREPQGELNSERAQAFIVLGVTPLATEPEIRKAYRRLIKRYHPDRSMHVPAAERELLKNATVRIRQAYETLRERPCRAP